MTDLSDLLLLLVVLTDFWVLGTTRLSSTIRAAAIQGALLAVLPIALHPAFSIHLIGLGLGTFIIKADGNPANLRGRLEEAAKEFGLSVYSSAEVPKAPAHRLAAPRVAGGEDAGLVGLHALVHADRARFDQFRNTGESTGDHIDRTRGDRLACQPAGKKGLEADLVVPRGVLEGNRIAEAHDLHQLKIGEVSHL